MKGGTQFTRPKHTRCSLNELYFFLFASSTHNFSNQNKSTVKKQLYSGKVPSFLTFVAIKRQYFELLAQEIKCRHSTADLCAQIYANMLISSLYSRLIGQLHNNTNMTKSTVLGCDVSCLKHGCLHLLTV